MRSLFVLPVCLLLACGKSSPGGTCEPTSCPEEGKNCGLIPDGCGGTLSCGTCSGATTCGGGGVENVCGNPSQCARTTCAQAGMTCGELSDGCGGTLNCGACAGTCTAGTSECISPEELTALALSPTHIRLTWKDTLTDDTGYLVEQSTDGKVFKPRAALPPDTTRFADSGLMPTTRYWYRVRATTMTGFSAYSSTADAQTLALTANTWATVGGNARHTGENTGETGKPPLKLAWTAKLAEAEVNPVVVENGLVYVTTRGGFQGANNLTALFAATGEEAWHYGFGDVFSVGQPSVEKGVVYVQHCNHSSNTKLWSFVGTTGTVRWSAPIAAQWENYWAPLVTDDAIYVNGGSYGGLYGFSKTDGAQKFFVGLAQYDEWSPAYDDGAIFTFVAGTLRRHDMTNGNVLATANLTWNWTGYDMRTAPVIAGDLEYVIAPPVLHAVKKATQETAWSLPGLAFHGMPAHSGDKLYAYSAGTLHVRDALNGTFLWSFQGDGKLSFPPVIAAGVVYVSSADNVYGVDLATRETVWTAQPGGWVTVADGKVFVAGAGGRLNAYSLTR